MADQSDGGGALSLFSGPALPGTDMIEQMAQRPMLPENQKWLRFTEGMLKPGQSYGGALSSAIGGYAGSQEKEAELQSKYIPLIAQALLQRQMQSLQIQQSQTKLMGEWDSTLTNAATNLLAQQGPITHQDLIGAISAPVQQGLVPPQMALRWLQNAPGDPAALRPYLTQKMAGAQNPEAKFKSLTPQIEYKDTGSGIQPVNVNAMSGPTPLGPVNAPQVGKTLSPAEAVKIEETPHGKMVVSYVTGKSAPVGTPDAAAIIRETQGLLAAGPGGAAQPPVGGAPTRSLELNPAMEKANVASAEDFAKEQAALNSRVDALQDVQMRLGKLRELQTQFRSGATSEVRATAAAYAKDIASLFGMPKMAQGLADGIAQGKLEALQEFQKLAVQGAMENLKSAMASSTGTQAGRLTQAEFGIFQKNSPSIAMDPNAMEAMFNFATEQYKRALQMQKFYADQRSQGVPLHQIPVNWNQQLAAEGQAPKNVTGAAQGARQPFRAPAPAAPSAQRATSLSGKPIKLNPQTGMWEYEE